TACWATASWLVGGGVLAQPATKTATPRVIAVNRVLDVHGAWDSMDIVGLQIAFTVGSEVVTPACWSCSTKLAYFRRGSGGLAGGPASSSPGPALFLVEEGPGQQAALLLALTHGDYPHIPYRQCGQPGTQGRQVGGPGHQGGEPEHLTGDAGALINHARQKTGFATVTHEFVVPTAEVQQRLPIGVSAEIAPLALAAPGCFGQVGMEGG